VVDPSAHVLHQSAGQEDMFPIEIDLNMVRRQRETGMKGLGQVLKSFRDRSVDFSVYDRNSGTDTYLKTLGPLEIPQQGSRAGLHVDVPARNLDTGPSFKGLAHDAISGGDAATHNNEQVAQPAASEPTSAPALTVAAAQKLTSG
jgi:hypothetical protein